MTSIATNYYPTQNEGQGFPLPPPPLKPRKQKALKDCYLSFIDEIQGGDYSGAILVRKEPRTNRDIYFKFRPRKARPTEMRSYRRNKTHKSVASYRTQAGGSTRANIAYLTCSFLELDGSTDGTIKRKEDVLALIAKNNLPTASYVSQTSSGNFHLIWTYNNPLPWKTKNESYWISQQKRLIQLFQKAHFNVDTGASLNPCQNLRNPSQLHAYNWKRKCKVEIHKSYKKTSLRRLYEALNGTNIPNPRPMKASTKLRRFLRANKTFTLTLAELAESLKTSLRTVQTQVSRAIQNGDLRIVARLGNNGGQVRATRYESMLFIEQFPEVQCSINTSNSFKQEALLKEFKAAGAENGRRNKTLFALGLHIKHRLGRGASIGAIRAELEGGAMRCRVREKEFERTLENVMKNSYNNPFSLSKLRAWDLIEEINHFH